MRFRLGATNAFLITAFLTALPAFAFPAFTEHDVNPNAEVVYAVDVADINGDKKTDIIGVSATYVAWYENPSWTPHRIVNQLRNDNVCLAVRDLDGDGVPELAVGADWQPNNTTSGGALYLLKHDGDPAKEWVVTTIRESIPTLHRIRWADMDGDERYDLVVAPLKGVGSKPPNYDDKPIRLSVLYPPKNLKDKWSEEVIDETLHVCHNIWRYRNPQNPGTRDSILAASFDGVTLLTRGGSKPTGSKRSNPIFWQKATIVPGNYEPIPRAGAGEAKPSVNWGIGTIATIEPWHGNQVVVHKSRQGVFERHVLDDTFAGGHLVYWGDFDGDHHEDLLAGHRENSPASNKVGLYVYQQTSMEGEPVWTKHVIDAGGMATEDGIVADINGDGRLDIVAGGRSTHNIKYYENLGEGK